MKVELHTSGYAQTQPKNVWQGPSGWTFSGILVVFYLVSVCAFMAAHYALAALGRRGLPSGALAIRMLLLAAAVNAAIVFGFVRLAGWANVEPRLAMIGLPLFLILESYLKKLREDRARRLPLWAGLAGSLGGACMAGFALMRSLPLH